MSNGVIKNCAAGVCCPPPLQEKALAVTIKEIAEGADSPPALLRAEFPVGNPEIDNAVAHSPRLIAAVPKGRRADLYLHLAAGLMERGLIGVSEAEAARLRKEGTPTEEELDRMLGA